MNININKSTNIVWQSGKVTYEDRCNLLGQKGLVVWFTGLSGSGKSTIAVEIERILVSRGRTVYRLDGDNIRYGINSDLSFSPEDRGENIRRIAEIAALFKDAGVIILASFISPYKKMRNYAKSKVDKDSFIEVYVKAKYDTCVKRDPKGLYDKALKGEIKDFTGVSSSYEEPENPELVLDTDKYLLEECIDKVLGVIEERIILWIWKES